MFKISLPQKTWQCEKRSVSVAYGDFLEINYDQVVKNYKKPVIIFETKDDYDNWCNINDLLKDDNDLDQKYEEDDYDM